MPVSTVLYSSGTITSNSNSGYTRWPHDFSPSRALLRLVPANLATDETLDLSLDLAFTSDGDGTFDAHTFTQVDSNNTPENVIVPGEDSDAELFVVVGTNGGALSAPLPPFWRLVWSVGGSTPSMDFTVYAVMD
jgi:hypothetical protein